MASEVIWPQVGTCKAQFGDAVSVHRDPDGGDVRLAFLFDDEEPFVWLSPSQLAELRELLDRSATPGQVSGRG